MNSIIADFFDIDVMLKSVCGGGEVLRDCVTRQIVECQVDYMACMAMLAGPHCEMMQIPRLACWMGGT